MHFNVVNWKDQAYSYVVGPFIDMFVLFLICMMGMFSLMLRNLFIWCSWRIKIFEKCISNAALNVYIFPRDRLDKY